MAGSEVAWSADPFSGTANCLAEFAAPEFVVPEFAGAELSASRSVSWSRRSDSRRPFEVSSWYPDRAGVGSVYQAVTLVFTRTTDPDTVAFTCTEDWYNPADSGPGDDLPVRRILPVPGVAHGGTVATPSGLFPQRFLTAGKYARMILLAIRLAGRFAPQPPAPAKTPTSQHQKIGQ